MNYTVTVRGPVPAELGRKIAAAHAKAIMGANKKP